MKIYVASSWRNAHQQDVVRALKAAGHDVYDFRNPRPGEHGFHWSEIASTWTTWSPAEFRDALDHPIARRGFSRDMEALQEADACVLVLPCGRSSHLEAGWMSGAGKPLFVLLADAEPELMYGMATALCLDLPELIEQIQLAEAAVRCLLTADH